MTVHPLDFEDASRARSEAARRRAEALEGYREKLEAAAEAKRNHRKARATAWAKASAEGGTDTAKRVRMEELAADAEFARDMADAGVKAAKERIDAEEADRAMVNALVQWSMKVAPMGQYDPNPQSTPRRPGNPRSHTSRGGV